MVRQTQATGEVKLKVYWNAAHCTAGSPFIVLRGHKKRNSRRILAGREGVVFQSIARRPDERDILWAFSADLAIRFL